MTTAAPDVRAFNPPLRSRRNLLQAISWDAAVVLVFWVLLSIAFGIGAKQFWSIDNFLAIASTGVVLAILSLGQTAAIMIGGFDLSVGGAAALAGVGFAILSNDGFGTWPSILIAVIGLGGAIGLVNALAINVVGINALIATLGTMSITGGLANIFSNGLALPLQSSSASVLANPTIGRLPIYVWVAIGLFGLAAVFLTRTTTGRSLYVLGGNRKAAVLAGLPVTAIAIGVYVVCAMLAALAGVVGTSELSAASPSVSSTNTLLSITAVVLGGGSLAGGEGGVGGTLVGVLVLATLSDGLAITGVPGFYQDLATGIVLLLAVGVSALRNRQRRQ